MPFRSYRSAPAAELGQVDPSSRKRVTLILSVPAVSLLLPGLAVEVANAGGSGELTRIAAAVSKFLLFYSGVFALLGLSAAVAAGMLAADRIVLSPESRILAQAAHRTTSLIGIAALANHIMLEIMASRAGIADSLIPFLAVRSTFFMGLGTLSSDVFVLVILTGVLRSRFTTGGRPGLWRLLHMTAYVAWPFAILHGLLAGRSAKPYVDWSYGACLAIAALALTARFVLRHRGRTGAPSGPPAHASVSLSSLPGAAAGLVPSAAMMPPAAMPPPAHVHAATPPEIAPRSMPRPAPRPRPMPPQRGPVRELRALPSPDSSSSGSWSRPPRWAGAPWTSAEAELDDTEDNGYLPEDNGYLPEEDGYLAEPQTWTASPDGRDL